MTLGSFLLCFFKNLDAGSGHQYDHCFFCFTVFSLGGGGEGESTPKNGLYGEAHRSVRISLFELYEKVGKSVISVCKKAQKG